MAKNYNTRKITSKRSYITREIAELFEVHVQTVRAWKEKGLEPIDPNDRPHLFLGSEVKNFLNSQRKSRRVKLKDDEVFCVSCQKAIKARNVKVEPRSRKLGKGVSSYTLIGECKKCNNTVNRFANEKIAQQYREKQNKQNKQTKSLKVNNSKKVQETKQAQASFFDSI